jgi:MFS family permease
MGLIVQENSGTAGRSFIALLFICCLVTFGCYFAVSMRLPVMPLYARSFGITTAQIGVINAAFYLMAGLLSLPSGMLSDRIGRKQLAIAGSVILFAGMILLYFGRSFFQLTGLYFLLGAGIAAFGPTMMSAVAVITPSTHLGRAYGWYTTALFCGLGMGPAAGGALGKWLGLRPVFLIGGGFLIAVVYMLQRYLPVLGSDAGGQQGAGRRRENIGKVSGNRPLLGCWAVTFGACVIGGMFFTFLPLFAAEKGLDVGQIGVVFLVYSVTNALSRIPFGAFSDRVGRRNYQALLGAVLVSLSIAGFAPAGSFGHFIAAALASGVSMAIAFTSIGALIAETTAPRVRGLAMGGYNTCIYIGLMTGSIGLGPLMEAVGFARGFLLTSVINLPFVAFFAWSMIGYAQGRADQ